MKRLTTIFSLILISIGAYATDIDKPELIDGGIRIKTFKEDPTNTLTIKNKYTYTDDGDDYSVIEIGNGTIMMKENVAAKYEKVVIEAEKLTTINALAFSNLIKMNSTSPK